MSQIYSYYLRAKQKYNQKSLFIWFSADSEKIAQNKLPYLMAEAGINEDHFFKPIRTNLPVVDELPPEGVFDSEFPQRFTHDANTNVGSLRIPTMTKARPRKRPAPIALVFHSGSSQQSNASR
ncbi:RecE family exodeoxyribonuclease [Hafnia alvei]|uniref:RecE family exodeoxyribonuclease n=1 Tax=Hafnia alvei TaxID=569 RepID=UPI00141248F4|nr:RecE family exodeoxyribonuclease [Hafnia alvei]QIP56864.1 hypothetical protein HBA19_15145 [Hafnia alvei]